jgi:PAS domain S-box-containing protein
MIPPVHTLLLVEDDLLDRERYRRYLLADSSCTYQLLEAGSAAVGLELCWTQPIDAILLDSQLPDANGLEFLEALYAQNTGSRPPVVMVADEEDETVSSAIALSNAVRAMKLGAEDYLLKHHLTAEMLQMAMRSAIENTRLRLQLRQTDHKRTEAALLESERRFREIFNTTYQFVGLLTPDGTLIEANQTALDFGGLTREEAVGRPFWEVRWWTISPQTQQQLQEAIYRASQGEFVRYEVEILGTTETTTTIDFSLKPVRDESGQVVLLIPEGRDISNRVRIDGVVSAVSDFIYTFDLEGRFTYINQPLLDLWQKTLSESIGKNFLELDYPPELAERLQSQIQQVITTRQLLKDETLYTSAIGTRAYEYICVPLFDGSGAVKGVAGVTRDITVRKEAELERSRLLAEAEAANRSKDEFIAVVAHELRSPLNSIMGWAKLLQTRKLDEAVIAKALDMIVRNTEAQVQLVEDLLDMSRMVRGTLQIQMAPVNWGNVIESALDIVRPMADAKQIQLKAHVAVLPQISGDFNRLQQIAVNLLTNAIKFTPKQGRVDVYLERVKTQAQLRVCDTGRGIAAEFLPLIFEQFQQEQQNTGSKDGLGLGLAIVENLVKLHSGTISAESGGLGQGATFTVRLPMLSAIAPKDDNPVISDVISLAGIRVLVVDDEPDMLNLISFVLEESGADVQSALNAAEALAQLPQFKPDILVSDIAMPGSNGYELLQQMRALPEGDIPAIALTAYASATYEERSLQAGFEQHFTKPVETENLITAIINLVNARNTCV